MRIDRPKEDIAQDLMAAAVKVWGAGKAAELRSEIDTHARHLSLIGKYNLPLDSDEPDFVVAPYPDAEAE